VKWGWCRELQSFIFVFEAANRIVLERPQYGMATYFFEMEQPLSATEQMNRIIACMSVPGISRLDLIANKEVLQEVVLSSGRKEMLEEYGWTADRGLGTLLNFSERVVHDHQMNADDWQAKIGRQISWGASMGRLERQYKPAAAGAPTPPPPPPAGSAEVTITPDDDDSAEPDPPRVKVEEPPSVEMEEPPSVEVEEPPSVRVEEPPSVKVEELPSVEVKLPSVKVEPPSENRMEELE